MKYLMFLLLSLVLFAGCTQQDIARDFGGTIKVEIPADQKFLNITWKSTDKSANLWVLTRNRVPSDTKDTYKFSESSSWGVLQGTVIIVEK
jgi:hypothetical protein